jgi:hypothetical protein
VIVTPIPEDRRRSIRRTALVLGLIALAFYIGFIMLGVYRSQVGMP